MPKAACIRDIALPAGTPNRERRMELRSGVKGRGRLLQAVIYWPDSPRSQSEALDILLRAAQEQGIASVNGATFTE